MADEKVRLAEPAPERSLAEAKASLEAAERVFSALGLDPERVPEHAEEALRHPLVERYRKTPALRQFEELLGDLEADRLALEEAKERHRPNNSDSAEGGENAFPVPVR